MKTATIFAAAFVFVAVVVSLSLREKRDAPEAPVKTIVQPAIDSGQRGLHPLPNAPSREGSSSSGTQVDGSISTAPQSRPNINVGRQQESFWRSPLESVAPHEVANPTLDISDVGRPFPVSRSAQVDCAPDSKSLDCEKQRRLDAFAQEPRDLAWAPQVERTLRDLIDQRNPDFSIRNVECRLVTCVLEVASLEGHLNPNRNLQYEEWREVRAKPIDYLIGLESDSLGRRITVTLQIYERIR